MIPVKIHILKVRPHSLSLVSVIPVKIHILKVRPHSLSLGVLYKCMGSIVMQKGSMSKTGMGIWEWGVIPVKIHLLKFRPHSLSLGVLYKCMGSIVINRGAWVRQEWGVGGTCLQIGEGDITEGCTYTARGRPT